ncbi:hypothetical protein [Undibacterium rugosum]|uniref:DUF4124 domain-containing protein n=1 Tax=Undibacterium rugosum TaxID=2762291 RepID=A0A923I4Y8_9BURK|nr:hypothetical protein [Undibacterium rugosum]MBC3936460.1 hypothetical protein [Undibacterium rugosum]MBR7779484.1 hypothetical protein [Undibacterium rugosum]
MSVSSRHCLAALLLSLFTPLLTAQNLYRCGSSYQDKPCDPGQKSQIIGTLPGNGNNGIPRAILDGECTRRGEEAKKIIWMREGGATQDALLAEAKTEDRRKLISDIYAQRGNSSDVRNAIEKDCLQEKLRHMPLPATPASPASPAAPGAPVAPTAPAAPAAPPAPVSPAAQQAAQKQLCSQLKEISKRAPAEGQGKGAPDLSQQIKALGCDKN